MRSFVLFLLILISANSAQIKDLASVIGVRENQLIGYGLVVGLNGTGDGSNSEFTIQSLSNKPRRYKKQKYRCCHGNSAPASICKTRR